MHRTHNCGELRLQNKGEKVILSGWVQRVRDKGGMLWVDLRDRYGITQLIFQEGQTSEDLLEKARKLGREFVIKAEGEVTERYAKNDKMPTGDIEIVVENLTVLNAAKTPPFTIEDDTDGGEELRMQYRYLDLRRNAVREKLQLRHKLMQATRRYMDQQNFLEVETPVLIKSTPEGARDFVVPSRVHDGEFYALPQSPQTFKQLLMVSGFDKYFQIVKCFRDEDLRADRQPEFTQIDCEMSFVEQEDVLNTFEGMMKFLFKEVKGVDLIDFERMTYAEAMRLYGSDKPDLRFGMPFIDISDLTKGKGFNVFEQSEVVLAINAEGCADYTRKQLDALTDFVKRPQIGAKGLVYVKCNEDGSIKSSVDKFYNQDDLKAWAEQANAKPGDLLLVLSGDLDHTRKCMNELRLKMGSDLGLRDKNTYKPLWVVDFPLLEWDEDTKRFHAMHHPFTSPKPEDEALIETDPGKVRANAYDMVINGVEIGGGSIRIHDRELQSKMFKALGFTPEEAQKQFGFLLDAFEYGAPPHGGVAFGFDRLCAMFGGSDSIRDYIAFPKNNAGRDVMIDSPATISEEQLKELHIAVNKK
ncbi:aspartate--tRNA ligase [Marivirga atlantica]|jgi:aspartyl-tRNA synthetase|uniref:Aspartate--tRNA ligase n=1 Tax=Marivirga atlantica TaxID=1548457 RepID=A0A937AFI2_9BACT|nr:aspartate--tRNA ligase [Marivirga atlantica]MBL0764649.1 aspartate--tRNA ligase [Marivirga atlantica]